MPAGRVLPYFVLNTDLAPTFADIGWASIPEFVDGKSFKPLLGGTSSPGYERRHTFLVEGYENPFRTDKRIYEFKALRTAGWVYVEHYDGQQELYDLANDRHQLNSLHESPEHQALIASLDARLGALRDCAGEVCRTAESAPLK